MQRCVMYLGMIETMSLKILLKGFHENYSDLFKKQHSIVRPAPRPKTM